MQPLLAVQLEQLKTPAQLTSQKRVRQSLLSTVSLLRHMQAWRGQDGQSQVKRWRTILPFGEDFGEACHTTLPLLFMNAGIRHLHLKLPRTLPCSVAATSDRLHKAGYTAEAAALVTNSVRPADHTGLRSRAATGQARP